MSAREGRRARAIYNNAVWCDTVCRAHGRPGEFLDGIWLNRGESPPFFPNAVTLAGGRKPAGQLARIRELVDAGLPGDWGVKDSYGALDLSAEGFRILFEAAWIYRAAPPEPAGELPGVRWATIGDAPGLAEWERAWRGEPATGSTPGQGRIFLPALLAEARIAVIAAYQAGRIVAGAIACRTEGVVGVSNLFAPAREGRRFRAGCLARIAAAFPGLPLAGYEAGDDLVAMRALGFDGLGPLRIWVRTGGRGPGG